MHQLRDREGTILAVGSLADMEFAKESYRFPNPKTPYTITEHVWSATVPITKSTITYAIHPKAL